MTEKNKKVLVLNKVAKNYRPGRALPVTKLMALRAKKEKST